MWGIEEWISKAFREGERTGGREGGREGGKVCVCVCVCVCEQKVTWAHPQS